MTLIEILEYAAQNGVELRIYNNTSFLFPKNDIYLYYLELAKENRRFRTIINSSFFVVSDDQFKEWLHDIVEDFIHHKCFTADEKKRKSEYSTPINEDLGILGE